MERSTLTRITRRAVLQVFAASVAAGCGHRGPSAVAAPSRRSLERTAAAFHGRLVLVLTFGGRIPVFDDIDVEIDEQVHTVRFGTWVPAGHGDSARAASLPLSPGVHAVRLRLPPAFPVRESAHTSWKIAVVNVYDGIEGGRRTLRIGEIERPAWYEGRIVLRDFVRCDLDAAEIVEWWHQGALVSRQVTRREDLTMFARQLAVRREPPMAEYHPESVFPPLRLARRFSLPPDLQRAEGRWQVRLYREPSTAVGAEFRMVTRDRRLELDADSFEHLPLTTPASILEDLAAVPKNPTIRELPWRNAKIALPVGEREARGAWRSKELYELRMEFNRRLPRAEGPPDESRLSGESVTAWLDRVRANEASEERERPLRDQRALRHAAELVPRMRELIAEHGHPFTLEELRG